MTTNTKKLLFAAATILAVIVIIFMFNKPGQVKLAGSNVQKDQPESQMRIVGVTPMDTSNSKNYKQYNGTAYYISFLKDMSPQEKSRLIKVYQEAGAPISNLGFQTGYDYVVYIKDGVPWAIGMVYGASGTPESNSVDNNYIGQLIPNIHIGPDSYIYKEVGYKGRTPSVEQEVSKFNKPELLKSVKQLTSELSENTDKYIQELIEQEAALEKSLQTEELNSAGNQAATAKLKNIKNQIRFYKENMEYLSNLISKM